MTWLDDPMVGFDTETTGVATASDRIVTAALITRTGDGPPSVRTWLIDPGIPIPAAASEVHGISTEKARAEGLQPADALAEIAGLLASALGAGIPVVGFNVQYDLSILEAELARNSLPTLAERLGGTIRPVVDPLVLDRHLDRWRRGSASSSTCAPRMAWPWMPTISTLQTPTSSRPSTSCARSRRATPRWVRLS